MCTPRPPRRAIRPWSTSTVARASDRARWLGVVEAPKSAASGSLAVRRLVAGQHPPGELGGVEHLERWPGPVMLAGEVLEEAHVEGGVVRHQYRAPGELQELGEDLLDPGASATMPSVMPVSTAMNGGISWAGLTSVWNSASTSPPRTFTAPSR